MKKSAVLVGVLMVVVALQASAFAGEGKGCCKQNFGTRHGKSADKACCAMKEGQHDANCGKESKKEEAAATNPVVAVPQAAVEVTGQAVNATGSAVANVVDAVTPDANQAS